ncbi:hypothetical protein GCM10020219_054530 [Nonomuraea dietziae]
MKIFALMNIYDNSSSWKGQKINNDLICFVKRVEQVVSFRDLETTKGPECNGVSI